MINLWEETIDKISGHGKTWEDVRFITNCFDSRYSSSTNTVYEIEKDDFERIAKTIDYDNGFGGQVINPWLKIVGDNWWLERHEYDGSEWWEFKIQPVKPTQFINEAKACLLDLDDNTDSLFIRYGG